MHTPWGTKRPLAVTYLVAVEVDINIELLEVAPSTSTAVALSSVDLNLEGFV
jgi:hypothetical protein